MADYEVREFASEAEWEQWLAANHDSAPGMRIALAKKGSGLESVTQPEALDVALCYGWIDGIRHALDDKRYVQTYTPRRSRSPWSQVNRDKVAALIAAGRMKPAGQAEIDRAKSDGRWDAAYAPVRNSEVPDDLAAAIAAILRRPSSSQPSPARTASRSSSARTPRSAPRRARGASLVSSRCSSGAKRSTSAPLPPSAHR
jgi:uncharacterized protein YdeI (YjbR/CyaY-like superfamily)